ncbi:T9SS type A sorting domain-containing protein [Cesiribacter sp. SM1]|uniref:T9SS type A sorting domain-containing protein n=1 Tax=Cesiribacter sp. SM1 TaxID=2861196 RepID=UPI001CD77B7C|nr:T9SS type A sorting domain-containing protein [Cesiribacter sp. SM1]
MQHNFYLLSLFFALLLTPFSSRGQAYQYETGVPVSVGQQNLQMPWAGGLNAVQASLADVNGNGEPELVLFDRGSSQVQVFAQTAQGWVWLPQERFRFPADITNWLLLVDYNGDGRKDLFTSTPAGVRVFENSAAAGQPAAWSLAYQLLEYPGSNAAVNLLVNSGDVPLIADTDGDGDIDIASFDPSGTGTIRWYKNVGVENFGRSDTLVFELADRHWGGLTECACKELAFNYAACPDEGGRAAQRPLHAGGKSLLWQDLNGDAVPDLLLGDEECTYLYYLPNAGTAAAPVFNTFDTKLPGAATATDFPFPAAYALGDDILVSTNLKTAGAQMDYGHSLWLYEQQPGGGYSLTQNDFLQGQQLDAGEEARPAFIDIDADGDLDLLLGNRGQLQADGYYAKLQLYENTGSAGAPAFSLKEADFLGLSAAKHQYLQPQFADYNGDGAPDLLLTVYNSAANKVRVLVYLNTAASGMPLQFSGSQVQDVAVPLTTLDYPYYYDVTGDGLLDVLAGRFDGSLRLYTNTGTLAAPAFELSSAAYKGFALDNVRRHLIPSVGDADGNGQPDLVVSDATGDVRILHSFLRGDASAAAAQTVAVEVDDSAFGARLGDKSWPVLAHLWAAEVPALVVGQIGGGLVLLRNGQALPPPGEEQRFELLVYPNPAYLATVKIQTNAPAQIRVLSMLGQVIAQWETDGSRILEWEPQLAEGMYLVEARFAGERKVKRLLIVR